MDVKEFDKVLLKTGETAYIADVIKAGVAYVADVDKADGEVEIKIIEQAEIERVVPDDFVVQ